MTISEFIEATKDLDPTTPVAFFDYEGSYTMVRINGLRQLLITAGQAIDNSDLVRIKRRARDDEFTTCLVLE